MTQSENKGIAKGIISSIADAVRIYVFEVDIENDDFTKLKEFQKRIRLIEKALSEVTSTQISRVDRIYLKLPKIFWKISPLRNLTLKNLILRSQKLVNELCDNIDFEIKTLKRLINYKHTDTYRQFKTMHLKRKSEIHDLYENYMYVLSLQ